MQRLTALFLTVFCLAPAFSLAQETVQDWSKKVIELQEKEGQNFEQDLQLSKGLLYLQRRKDALQVLNRLMKGAGKKDSRVSDLYETASDQFFFQETAEIYADVIQLIRAESFAEAKEKLDVAIQKEPKHRLLTLRAIQLGLVLNQVEALAENAKVAEQNFPDTLTWKIYNMWMLLQKNDAKEAYKILSLLWSLDRKVFEQNELPVLAYLQSLEGTKHAADWGQLAKIIQKHPEWVGVRFWRLKNKSFAAADRKNEIDQLSELFKDLKKLKNQREKEQKNSSYFYLGLISVEKTQSQFEEWKTKSLEKTSETN